MEITAPQPPEEPARTSATLQVVLDRSGSMRGAGKLDGAKRPLLALVDRLDSSDSFGLVSFDKQARLEIPAGPLHDKDAARARIAALQTGGSTDLSSGLLRGIQGARRASADSGATLLLISDGHANQGVTDYARLTARGAYRHGVGISTLGSAWAMTSCCWARSPTAGRATPCSRRTRTPRADSSPGWSRDCCPRLRRRRR